jgi:hypothetical protein
MHLTSFIGRPFYSLIVAGFFLTWLGSAAEAQLVRSAAGGNAAAIQATVNQFRTDLGALNANVAGSFPSGRREINWDGVPDSLAAPNNLPANFFNVNSPRGVVFSTPGTGFQVSANSANPTGTAVEFGNIDPNYPTFFAPFSAQRLFTALGSNITDVTFFVPGATTPALVTGFGVLFSDVDVANSTSLEFFDGTGTSLGTFVAGNIAGNETFSFLGVSFSGNPRIGRVRITSGNQVLSPGNTASDLVVMDDFIYGEPRVPSPTPTPTPTPSPTPARLANISTRLRVETGDNALIGGFIVTGTPAKKVILRAIGPSLPFADRLANPTMELRDSDGGLLDSNDNWVDSLNQQAIIDSTIPPKNDLESAILVTLAANNSRYTAIVRGVDNGTGTGVVEVYDLDTSANSKLANISTRGLVQGGDNVLIAGTIVVGQASQKVIIRALGPSVPVPGNLADPLLELHDNNGALLEANDNWVDSPNKQAIIDSTIPPTNNLESAIVRTLTPANYTAIVRGVNDTTGIAVVEVYALN